MDIKFLSRKFLLSVMLAVIATLLVWQGLVQSYQWQWVIMATAVSYVTANAINKKTETNDRSFMSVRWQDRIVGLFNREFIICTLTVIVSTLLLFFGHITSDAWFVVCSALAVAYNIGNAVSKL